MSIAEHLSLVRRSGLSLADALAYLAARWTRSRYCPERWRNPAALVTLSWHGTPVVLRLGTTDLLVFQVLLLEGHYTRLAAMLEIEPVPGRPIRILDLGAYTGLSAACFATLYPGCELLCLEPEPANFQLLERNLAGLPASARSLRAFVGASGGHGYIRDAGLGEWGFEMSRSPSGARGLPTPILDVPSLLDGRDWDFVDLIKCNIEGAEIPLFGDCRSWLRRARNLIVELHPPYDVTGFTSDLSRNGADFDIRGTVTAGDRTVCAVSLRGVEG